MSRSAAGVRAFLSELKRRRVFRVAAVYAAVAFVMVQVADIAFPALHLPDWTLTLVVGFAIVGFPFALVLAWAYDITPEGVVRADVESPAGSNATLPERPQQGEWNAPSARARDEDTLIRSIAVLPFANISADPENEYFSDGITEELLNMLAKVPDLRVAARTSAFAFKGKNESIRRIGEELGVEAVLEGSVRRSGDRVRIMAQLIDVADGYHLWSESYDRQLVDIFAIQEETARAVVRALEVKLPGADRRATKQPTQDPEAHDLYLRGRYAFNQASGEGIQKALGFFQQAIERDPAYAPAHAAVAISYTVLPILTPVAEIEVYPKAKAAALRSLEIEESVPEAHTALAYVLLRLEWDWEQAERHFKRALDLNPSSAEAHEFYAEYLVARDRLDEAFFHSRRSEELDPLSLKTLCEAAILRYLAGDYPSACKRLEDVRRLEPNFFTVNWYLGIVYSQMGRHEQAITVLERAVELCGGVDLFRAFLAAYGYAPAGRRAEAVAILEDLKAAARERHVNPTAFSLIYAGLDDKDQALYWLEQAVKERAIPAFVLLREPIFSFRRSDPRFVQLLTKVGLA